MDKNILKCDVNFTESVGNKDYNYELNFRDNIPITTGNIKLEDEIMIDDNAEVESYFDAERDYPPLISDNEISPENLDCTFGSQPERIKFALSTVRVKKEEDNEREEITYNLVRQFSENVSEQENNDASKEKFASKDVKLEGDHDGKCSHIVKTSESGNLFVCTDCTSSFKKKLHLVKHLTVHSSEKSFPCQQCSATFTQECNLNRHAKMHAKPKRFSCSVCSLNFPFRNWLSQHMKVHEDKQLFSHSNYTQKFKSQTNVRALRENNSNAKLYFCSQCSYSSINLKAIKRHLNMHSEKGPFYCELCPAEYEQKSNLQIHSKMHLTNNQFSRTHNQSSCGSNKKYELNSSSEVPADENPFFCAHCLAEFKSRISLLCHVKLHKDKSNSEESGMPSKQILFACPYCTDTFKNKTQVQKHLKMHLISKSLSSIKGCCKIQDSNSKSCPKQHESMKSMACKFCLKKFKSSKSLKVHLKIHTDQMPFHCLHCPAKFPARFLLNTHLKIHSVNQGARSGVKPYVCQHCFAHFELKAHFLKHLKLHSNQMSCSPKLAEKQLLPCNQCSLTFLRDKDLKRHVVIHNTKKPFTRIHQRCSKLEQNTCMEMYPADHTDKKPHKINHCFVQSKQGIHLKKHLETAVDETYTCPQCPTKFRQISNLKEHMAIHTEERPFTCSHCSANFKLEIHLKKHLKGHSEERPYSCPQCPAKFKQNSNLRVHMASHTIKKPQTSSRCSAKSKQKIHLTKHSKTAVKRLYPCSQCTKKFRQNANLKMHMATHTDEKPYACNHCSSKFKLEIFLKNHLRIHSDEKLHACAECPAKFNDAFSLKLHVKQHNREKLYVCSECSAKFKYAASWKKHLKKHEKQKPYVCPQCSARFRKSCYLKSHLLTHSNEKPFGCLSCPAKFKRKSHLNRHTMIHTDERPFACTSCSAKFRDRYSLKIHKMTHFNRVLFPCTYCSLEFKLRIHLKTHLKRHKILDSQNAKSELFGKTITNF